MTAQSIAYLPHKIKDIYTLALQLAKVDSIKSVPQVQIAALIPKDACPQQWGRSLRNFEYNLNYPKPKIRKRRRSAGTGPRNSYFVRLALSQLEVAS